MRCPISADSSIRVFSCLPERRALAEGTLRIAQPLQIRRNRGREPATYHAARVCRAGVRTLPRGELVGELGRDLEIVEPSERRLQLGDRCDVFIGAFSGKQRGEKFGGVAQLLCGHAGPVALRCGDAVYMLGALAELPMTLVEYGTDPVAGERRPGRIRRGAREQGEEAAQRKQQLLKTRGPDGIAGKPRQASPPRGGTQAQPRDNR